MKIEHTLLLFAILFANIVQAQNYADSLTTAIGKYQNETEIPGLVVVISDRNKIVYQHGFGYADFENKKPFTPQTIQNIGSVSKTFVAVALMKAIELKYFTLETDINEILPFKVINPYFPNEVIRVKDLTTHVSGIIDNQEIYTRSVRFRKSNNLNRTVAAVMKEHGYTSDLSDTTLSSFLKAYLSTDGRLYNNKNFSNSKPGKRASYSNIGSALAAYLIEIKSGMSFARFSEKYTLKPLKMNNSDWFLTEKNLKQHSIPYLNKQMAFPYYSITTYPDGGLRTSALDLSKYVLEMMHTLNGNPHILSQQSGKIMLKPVFTPSNLPENMSLRTRNKGIFWNIYTDGYIGHDGDDPGVSSNIQFNHAIGIVFICNLYLEDRTKVLNILKKYGEQLIKEAK
ncbi:beta-lactamase family protein [Pedobacter sp. PAMC26386]|nr:beta-lactamase family protein [Pedobacter sp. PAMC26386]